MNVRIRSDDLRTFDYVKIRAEQGCFFRLLTHLDNYVTVSSDSIPIDLP